MLGFKYYSYKYSRLIPYCRICWMPAYHLVCNTCLINPIYCFNDSDIPYNISYRYPNLQAVDQIYCNYRYISPLSQLLHAIKYRNIYHHAWELGYMLFRIIKFLNIDIVIPMPMHISKHKTRRFNQVELLLNYSKLRLNLLVDDTIVSRTKHIKSQALTANMHERHSNLIDAFVVHKQLFGSVLVIDDVITTGSTMNALTRLLKFHGAKKIIVATLMMA